MKTLIDFILHIDVHLVALIAQYGTLIYAILFLIVFVETGLVIMPFLPGDSLIFAAAAISAYSTGLNVWLIAILFVVAAFCGDNMNYFIGRWVGPKAFSGKIRFLKKEYLEKTHAFFEKHGGMAVIYARFVPIVRTFAPFVAGVGQMPYRKFISRSILAALLWVGIFSLAGYFFGNIPLVKNNFSKVILIIIILSLLPMLISRIKHRFKTNHKSQIKEQN